jgi:betaine-aldehyde dehydrogenase
MRLCQSIIGGKAVCSGLPMFEKRYPATGEVIAQIEPATTAMLDMAVGMADAAQKSWAATDPFDRAKILHRAATLMREANDELARLEVQDVGKLFSEAVTSDVPSGTDAFDFFAAAITTQHGDFSKWRDAIGYSRRVPLGVCAGIGAWNYPMQIACWKAAPALAAGNAFILKPSEETPLVAHRVAELLQAAGLPDGLFQIIHGGEDIGAAICRHPGIAKISLTGGVDTGRLVMGQSATTLKKVTLELGGKSPLIIFDDCDFDHAVQTALDANFYTAGEVCSNATRVFVHRPIADAFVAAVTKAAAAIRVGDPMADDVGMGALISAPHLARVLDYVQSGLDEGATLATGGAQLYPQGFEGGNFMQPTIMTGCGDTMRIVREEIFGPVMSILVFDSEDEAVTRANASDFGLGAGLMTRDLARAHRVADALDSGNVWVNSYNLLPPGLPFGGAKQSGFGRENGLETLAAYSEIKSVYIQL